MLESPLKYFSRRDRKPCHPCLALFCISDWRSFWLADQWCLMSSLKTRVRRPEKMDKPLFKSLSSSTAVPKPSLLPSSSKPTNLPRFSELFYVIGEKERNLSRDTPSMKQITHGKTLIESFSTSQGMFSTKTRINRVWKYFGASFCHSSWGDRRCRWGVENRLLDACPWFRIAWSWSGKSGRYILVLVW